MDLKAKLAELGYELPPAPTPVAAYVPYVESAGHIFFSGTLPFKDGKLYSTGPLGVPGGPTIEHAQEAARYCAINSLVQINAALKGDWSRMVRLVRLGVFVASSPTFIEQHIVANGASEFITRVLGPQGMHARSAVGVPCLPLGASVEVDMVIAVNGL